MADQELDTLLREERAYSSQLAKKVQEQASELKRQVGQISMSSWTLRKATQGGPVSM